MVDSSLDALRAAQEQALARMGEAWRFFTKAVSYVPVPGERNAGEHLQQLADALTTLTSATTTPLRKLVEGQRELADKLEKWGDLQDQMADLTRSLAHQQRIVADVLGQTLMPLEVLGKVTSAEDLEKAAKEHPQEGGSGGSGGKSSKDS
jgi:hypothetical protein